MATKNCICKCKGCGILFKPKKADRISFCSRDCAFKNVHLIRNNQLRKEKESLKRISKAKHTTLKSIFVLKEISALIRIKNKNKRQYGTLNKKTYGRCQCCFNLFVFTIKMGRYKSLCSSNCEKQKYKESRKKSMAKSRASGVRNDKDRTHRSRARRHGVAYEPINVFKVFDRDKWKCHICGVKTPKDKRGTIELNAPELDHIITFAEGGDHTYNNVACCCRKCNADKNSKSKGQIFLFGKI
jgi:hypothetical protein